VNILTYEHKNINEIIDKEVLTNMLTILKNTNIKLNNLKSTDIKKKIEELFRENGWSSRISVDPFLNHYISGIYKNIGLITQFGNMAMCYADLLKLELLHKRNMIDCAMYILLTKNDKRARKDNYAQFEKLSKHLNLYNEVVETPLLLIGVENGENNEIRF